MNAAIRLVCSAIAYPAPSTTTGEVDGEALEVVGNPVMVLMVLPSVADGARVEVTEPPATPLGPTDQVIPDIEPATLW